MRNIQEKIENAKNNIKNHGLERYFEKEWLQSLLINKKYEHPIFRILIDEIACSKLSQDLDVLVSNCNKYKRLIRKLESANDLNNFISVMTEIEVISYYYKKYGPENIEYEPEIEVNGNIKRPDLKLNVNGEEYYLEILTVLKEAEDKKMSNIISDLRNKINEINQSYVIDLIFERDITENELKEFYSFIEELLKDEKLVKKSFNFIKNGEKIIEVHFREFKSEGYVGTIITPAKIRLKDAIRPKNKILDKLDDRQLPKNTKNVIIVKLHPSSWCDFDDIRDAFLGRFIYMRSKNAKKSYPIREENGIIDDQRGKIISLLIAYESDYEKREFFLNPNAENPINEDEIDKL